MAKPHLFHHATVSRIIKETADTRTYVLAPDETPFPYRAGQFCTFKVHVDGEDLYRSYSMSSAPETDSEMATTVKRVPGGKVSNWMLDNLVEGDDVTITRAAGTFCLAPTSVRSWGSAAVAASRPSCRWSRARWPPRTARCGCCAPIRTGRRRSSMRCSRTSSPATRIGCPCQRHIDHERGLLEPAAVVDFVGADADADCYVCGPEGFMSVVTSALPGPGKVFIEDFDAAPQPHTSEPAAPAGADETGGTITIHLDRKKVEVPRRPNETLLESARRAGLSPPFSCEAGNCGTCMARLAEGSATMKVNDALETDEVEEGYVLTCQAIPDTPSVTVHYED